MRGALSLAIAGALLAGCVTGKTTPPARLAADASAALDLGNVSRSIKLAEKAVEADPRNREYRTLLGNAYLRAGRFISAHQAYADAVELGGADGKLALSLALVRVAIGRNSDAIQTLNANRDSIPAADFGLALALAGDPARGVTILTERMRGGENTAKVRQNLAFAYALDGRWLQSRIMAAQDVPAGELDARMSEWALLAKPEAALLRVAGLLKVPSATRDGGLPAALALQNAPSAEQLAQEAAPAAPAAAPRLAIEDLPAPDRRSVRLQYLAHSRRAGPAPAASPAAVPLPEPAFAKPQPAFVKAQASVREPLEQGAGTHLVQLGSFSSAEGASRAWQYYRTRNPALVGYRNMLSKVTVNGRQYWRLLAVGFPGKAPAHSTCAAVKAKGGACLVMASRQVAPKADPARGGAPSTGIRLARSR